MTASWFHRFFRLFWKPQESARKEAHRGLDCQAINLASGAINPESRAREFGLSAPNCVCEHQTTSPYSLSPVSNIESLTRFIFSPIHISKKNGRILPSAFSHVATKGCSVQREEIATTSELKQWIDSYQQKNSAHTWIGTLASNCKSIREIQLSDKAIRILAVYDTAEDGNPAHAEIFQTEHIIEEVDRPELRAEILRSFGNGVLTEPSAYRSGALWS